MSDQTIALGMTERALYQIHSAVGSRSYIGQAVEKLINGESIDISLLDSDQFITQTMLHPDLWDSFFSKEGSAYAFPKQGHTHFRESWRKFWETLLIGGYASFNDEAFIEGFKTRLSVREQEQLRRCPALVALTIVVFLEDVIKDLGVCKERIAMEQAQIAAQKAIEESELREKQKVADAILKVIEIPENERDFLEFVKANYEFDVLEYAFIVALVCGLDTSKLGFLNLRIINAELSLDELRRDYEHELKVRTYRENLARRQGTES